MSGEQYLPKDKCAWLQNLDLGKNATKSLGDALGKDGYMRELSVSSLSAMLVQRNADAIETFIRGGASQAFIEALIAKLQQAGSSANAPEAAQERTEKLLREFGEALGVKIKEEQETFWQKLKEDLREDHKEEQKKFWQRLQEDLKDELKEELEEEIGRKFDVGFKQLQDAAAATAATARRYPPPDTSNEYLRNMLLPSAIVLSSQPDPDVLQSFLEGPLGRKLPSFESFISDATYACGSDILPYIIEDESLKLIMSLALAVTVALSGDVGGLEPTGTFFDVQTVVDKPLRLAAIALNLNIRVDRNGWDTSDATTRLLRPDFLCWVDNVLLFKGVEKSLAGDMAAAIAELTFKMANTWKPELLPGVSMPCMLGYAAAGNLLQFFAIVKSGGRPTAVPISSRYDMGTALGRIRAFHGTCNIVRLLASYARQAPELPFALGSVKIAEGSRGEFRRSVMFFEDFVQKRVFSFWERHAGINDFSTLQDLYSNATLMECSNLASLQTPGDIHLEDGETLVLHLVPVGVPQYGPPEDETSLKRAVRDVLTGVAALHAAGFVHRNIRWDNVVEVPGVKPGMASKFVLIDLEHAARADCPVDCREPPFPLASWPPGILNPEDGRYTPASDLCLVSRCLMSDLSFTLSPGGQALQHALATRQLSAEGALAHDWFAVEKEV